MMPEEEEIAKREIAKLIDGKAWKYVQRYLEQHLAFRLFHSKTAEEREKIVAERDVMNSFFNTLTTAANEVRGG